MHLFWKKFITIFSGQASKREQLWLFCLTIGIFFASVIISQIYFPGGYSMLHNYVSDLGGIAINPHGYLVFNIGMIITGILLIPFCLWFYKRLMPTPLFLTRLATICLIISCAGFVLIGLFPVDLGEIHDVSTIILIGGIGSGSYFTLFILLRKIILGNSWPSKMGFIVAFGPPIIVGILAMVFQFSGSTLASSGIDPAWFSWPPWEWALLLSGLAWILCMLLLAPAEIIRIYPPNLSP